MAEPAQILGPPDQDSDESSARPNLRAVPSAHTYDDQDDDTAARPRFGVIQGGGNASAPRRGHLSAVKDGEAQGAKGPGSALGAAGGAAGLAADVVGKGFNPEVAAALHGLQKAKDALWGGKKQKRRTLISGGVIGSTTLIIVIVAVMFLPNAVVSIMSDLENRVFAVLDHDLENELKKEMQHFLRNEVFGATNTCGPTVNPRKFANCIKKLREDKQKNNTETADEDPIEGKGGLMDAWVNSDLTGQFAQKGITFSEERGKYFINSDAIHGGSLNVTEFVKGDSDLFDLIGKNAPEFSDVFKGAMDSLVVEKGSYLHTIFTKLLGYLYGVRWCVMDCGPGNEQQDRAQDTVADKENTLEAQEYEKVVEPTAAVEGQGLEDVINGDQPGDRQAGTESAAKDVTAGDTTVGDVSASEAVNEVATKFGSEKLASLIQSFNDLKTKGADYIVIAVAKALGAVLGTEISTDSVSKVLEGIGKAVSIAAWVQLVLQFLHFLLSAGTTIPAMYNKIHATFEVSEFALYAATSDEQKSGYNHPDLTMLGSIAKGFSAPDKNGNPSSAMQSPMLQQLIDGNNTEYSNGQVHSYLEDGHFALDGGSKEALTKLSQNLNAFRGLGWIVDKLNWAINFALGPLTFVMEQAFKILGINSLISKVVSPVMGWISGKLFPLPDMTHLSGEDRGTAVAMGADIAGNQAVRSIGGEVNGKAAAIALVEQEQDTQRQFESRPLFARMFATDTPYSFVSRLSLKMPLNFGVALQSSFTTLIENPLGRFFGGFTAILDPGNVFAAPTSTAAVDAGGVEQYAIPDTDPVFQEDPEVYWKTHDCAQQAKEDYPSWNKAVKYNPTTGQWEHETTNGCLTIQRSAEAAGTLFGGVQDGS